MGPQSQKRGMKTPHSLLSWAVTALVAGSAKAVPDRGPDSISGGPVSLPRGRWTSAMGHTSPFRGAFPVTTENLPQGSKAPSGGRATRTALTPALGPGPVIPSRVPFLRCEITCNTPASQLMCTSGPPRVGCNTQTLGWPPEGEGAAACSSPPVIGWRLLHLAGT